MPTRPRRRRRASIIVYLVALTLLPALGVPLLAQQIVSERLDEATAARRIGGAMDQVRQLDALFVAIDDEVTSASIAATAARQRVTFEVLDDAIFGGALLSVDDSRAATDRRIGAVQQGDDVSAELQGIRADMAEARTTIDAAMVAPPEGPEDLRAVAIAQYLRAGQRNSALQQATVRRIATGRHGVVSPDLLAAADHVRATMALVEMVNRESTMLGALVSAHTTDERAGVLRELRAVRADFERNSRQVPADLPPRLADAWRGVVSDPAVLALHDYLGVLAQISPNEPVSEGLEMAQAVTNRKRAAQVLSQFTSLAVDEGVSIATADAQAADRRASGALVGAAILLTFTGAGVVVVGGLIRRRLRALARTAERISAGELEALEVHGPKEIAVVSEALNDAVENFRRVALQAEIVASGDLEDPRLREPTPGALGTAVHDSVDRLVRAVKEREELRATLAHRASHDSLTDLPNRAEAERLLREALERAAVTGADVAVFFVDLDGFKGCNDTFGHAAGDEALKAVAQRITDVVRPSDIACRVGGDEFVVLVDATANAGAIDRIAERMVSHLSEPIRYEGATMSIGASVGIARSAGCTDVETVLRAADRAMYLAKTQGGSRWCTVSAAEPTPRR